VGQATDGTQGTNDGGLELLAREALSRWDLAEHARLDLIKHRENAVFGVTATDGHRFVLRVHRADYHTDASLRSELQWMAALREAGIATAAVIPTSDGEMFVRVRVPGLAQEHQCDLLSWVNGAPLGSAEERSFSAEEAVARTYLATGRLAAKIHNQATAWERPAGFERSSWDEAGCLGPEALWGHWSELTCLTADERTLLEDGSRVALEALGTFGKSPDRYGLVHSDLVPDNLLDDGVRTAVIDFDDCGFGWHLWEMATCVYWHLSGDSYQPALGSFVQGYREHRALPAEHVARLPVFLLVRGLVYLGWIHSRRETDTATQILSFVREQTLLLARQVLGEAAG
jgi:Ser/Thr protein kinase RdoA (MazF antagonist)